MFPKVPQSSLRILTVTQLAPPLKHPTPYNCHPVAKLLCSLHSQTPNITPMPSSSLGSCESCVVIAWGSPKVWIIFTSRRFNSSPVKKSPCSKGSKASRVLFHCPFVAKQNPESLDRHGMLCKALLWLIFARSLANVTWVEQWSKTLSDSMKNWSLQWLFITPQQT